MAAQLADIDEPFAAKSRAKQLLKQYNIKARQVDDWKLIDGLTTLGYAVALKFMQNKRLLKMLLDTGDALLVQAHDGDKVFACGQNQGMSLQSIDTLKYLTHEINV